MGCSQARDCFRHWDWFLITIVTISSSVVNNLTLQLIIVEELISLPANRLTNIRSSIYGFGRLSLALLLMKRFASLITLRE